MKQTWTNNEVRKELYVEYLGCRPSEFTMLEPVYETKASKKKGALFDGGSDDED